MPLKLPNQLASAAERPHQPEPWMWLWEIELDAPAPPAAPTWTRLTPYPFDVTWPPGTSDVFYSIAMNQAPIEQSGEGQLPTMEITVDNTGRFLMEILETAEFEGNRATCYLVNRGTVATVPTAFVQWDFVIAAAVANRRAVTLRLEMPNFFDRQVPGDRFSAARCRWLEFGGSDCGYVINSAAAFKTCDRRLDSCVARGLDELSRGLPVKHPLRFGAFAGVAVQRIA